jgi:hypothetical protein
MEKAMSLSKDKIKMLYQTRRVKGLYEDKLGEFIESDEAAINPYEVWPFEFPQYVAKHTEDGVEVEATGKSPTTVYQGFRNAANKLPEALSSDIDVIQRDGEVYVCLKSRVELVLADEASEDDEEDEDNSSDELESNLAAVGA